MNNNVVKVRQAKTWAWTVGSFVVALASVVALSTIDAPDGKPLLETSVIVQVISIFGLVASVTLPPLINARKDAAVVREQVQNTHTVNMRDDQDDKHSAVIEAVETLATRMDRKFDAVASEFRGVRADIGRVVDRELRNADAILALAERLEKVEDRRG
jgi:hypothetical protein